jgi:hypothetical protein
MAIMTISGKVSDMFNLRAGTIDYDGYVPYGLGIGGDYIRLEIDTETGKILNWVSKTETEIQEAISDFE